MLKKLFCLAFSIICLSSMTNTFAMDNAIDSTENEPFILVETSARGTSLPTRAWDLKEDPYEGSFYGLRTGLYTNRYFTGVTTFDIIWDNVKNTGPQLSGQPYDDVTFRFQLYDMTDKSWVSGTEYESRRVSYFSGEILDGSKRISGLNSSHKYAFFFENGISDESVSQLSGEFVISLIKA